MAEAWLGLLGFELVRRQGFERVLEKVSQQYIKRVFSRHIYILFVGLWSTIGVCLRGGQIENI